MKVQVKGQVFFAKNDNGSVALFHRASISTSAKGVGRKQYLDWSGYSLTAVGNESAILIGFLDNDDFFANLENFVKSMLSFKRLVDAGEIGSLHFITNQDLVAEIESEDVFTIKKSASVTSCYSRSELVKEYALRVATDKCQLCEKDGPFVTRARRKFLEVHHVIWLSEGGSDIPENVVALCPNCHRKMHIIDDDNDVRKLRSLAIDNYQNFIK